VVIASAEAAAKSGAQPIARLTGYSVAGVDPKYIGIGPVPAIRDVLKKTGLKLEDMDVIELNEAFAAQSLAVIQELDLPAARPARTAGLSRWAIRLAPAAVF